MTATSSHVQPDPGPVFALSIGPGSGDDDHGGDGARNADRDGNVDNLDNLAQGGAEDGVELRLPAWPLGALARLENLVVAYPGEVPAPAAPDRLRNRRGRLVEATLVTDLDRLTGELERPGVRARLAAGGISDLRVGLSDGTFRLVGRAMAGDRDAAFTARAQLDPGLPRQSRSPGDAKPSAGATHVRVSILDLRIYGFLPVAAPLVARAILSSLVQAKPGGRGAIDFDPLEAALLETFAAHGWRLPDVRHAHLQPIEITAGRIAFGWRSAPAHAPPDATAPGAHGFDAPPIAPIAPAELEEGDGLLARGDRSGALDAYRRALKRSSGAAATRVLEVLISTPGHVAEADSLAAEILTRQAEEPLPLLVRAVAAAERGDAAQAADAYEQIAIIARRRNEDEDVVIARLVAAEQWLRADKTERARRLAEQVLATMPAHAAGETARLLQILGERLLIRGELAEADQVFESRLALASDGATRATLVIERARARLLARDGLPGALELLATLPLDQAPREALELRAELAERQIDPDHALPALDELAARARREGDEPAAQRFEQRVVRVVGRARDAHALSAVAELPAAHTVDGAALAEPPAPATHTAAPPLTAARPDPVAPTPPPSADDLERLGQSAEASGDLDRAAQAYGRAATIEGEPMQRASFLVSHARVLLARGETETAIAELEEALARAPTHGGALGLLGDLAFRLQDWARARAIYAALAASPGAAEVISRELLLYRRAQIALATGPEGESEAENHLREVAILNPRHVEAREAMADIALRRGDFGGAALRLEEVLRLLPLDALDRLLDVRQRLGGVYLQLQDWTSARYYLELVLAQDPTRPVPLTILIDVYARLGAHRAAAEACGRLARLHVEPRLRAEILYRQGEILRAFLDDGAGALDAFLRAADLDPQFTPALVRLADHYWRHGAFEDLAELASELGAAGFVADDDSRDLPLRLAIATRLVSPISSGESPGLVPPADQPTGDVGRRAALLAEAASFLGGRAPQDLDPVLDALANEGRATTEKEDGRGPASGFYRALEDLVQEDPASANMGAVRALGRAAERGGWTAAARGLYSVLVFVNPGDAAGAALHVLGASRTVDANEGELEGMLALLAQNQPLDALEAIARADPLASAGGDRDDPARRRELLRTLPARELVSTILSLDYQRAVS
jgi:tetratricopeptide (TPR) repeat protein